MKAKSKATECPRCGEPRPGRARGSMSGQWCESCGVYLMFEGDLLLDIGYCWQPRVGWVDMVKMPGVVEAVGRTRQTMGGLPS